MEFAEALLESRIRTQDDAAQYVAPGRSYVVSVSCCFDEELLRWDAEDGGQGEPYIADVMSLGSDRRGPTIRATSPEELAEKLAHASYPITLSRGWEPYTQALDDPLQRLVERLATAHDLYLAQGVIDRVDIVLRRLVAADAPAELVQQVDETAYALVRALEAGAVSRSTLRAAAHAQEQVLAWMRERGQEGGASHG